MDISTLSGISSLLGGYLKGKQLKQNKDIKAKQLERETTRDAINLSHQKEMERIAGERLKLAQNPQPKNEDPAMRLTYEAGLQPIIQDWKDTQTRLSKAPSRRQQTPIAQGFLTKVPQHLQALRGLIDKYPSMSMGLTPEQKFQQITGIPLESDGVGGFKLPSRKVKQGEKEVDELYLDPFLPSPEIPMQDLQKDYDNFVRIPAERGQFQTEEELMGAQQAWIKKTSDEYGEDVAQKIAGIPYGTQLTISQRQAFVPPKAGLNYSPASPQVRQDAGGLFEPVTGRTIATDNGQGLGMYRAQVTPQMMRQGFNPTPRGFTIPGTAPAQLGPNLSGPAAIQGQAGPTPGQPHDPLRIARAIFADEVMSGNPLSITPEQRQIKDWMTSTGKNPFADPNAMRELYSLLPQDSYAKAMFRDVAMSGGNRGEYAPYEKTTQDITYRHTIRPTATVRAIDQKMDFNAEAQPWNIALKKLTLEKGRVSIDKMKSDIQNTVFDNAMARDRFTFERGKFVEEMGLKKDKFSFEKTKEFFSQRIRSGQLSMQELTALNGLGSSARGVLMGANNQLQAATARVNAARQQWGMMGTVAANIDITALNKWAEGKPLTPDEEAIRMKDSANQSVFNMWKEVVDARSAQKDAEMKVAAAEAGVAPFVEWADQNMQAAQALAAENQRKAEAAAAKKGGKGANAGANAGAKPGTGAGAKPTRRNTGVK